jgi:hypothetical protein
MDFIFLLVVLLIGAAGGYAIGQTEGANVFERVQNFFGIRRPPAR